MDINKGTDGDIDMVNACLSALTRLAEKDKRIIIMGSDSMHIREKLSEQSKKQYIEMGIAESDLIGAASGVAGCGLIPYVYAVAPFLVYRANEFIRNDICLQKRNVKIVGYSAGMDYCTSGPTHHTTEDIAMLRVLPNLTILSPASARETEQMIYAAAEIEGPVYIRLNRESNREIYLPDYRFEYGKAKVLNNGDDLTVIVTGSIAYEAIQAVKEAEKRKISVRLLYMGTIKPIDEDAVLKAAKETQKIITIEEHSIIGGLGGAVAEIMAESEEHARLVRMGLKDAFATGYGNHDEIKEMNGLSVKNIIETICFQD